jgi:glutamate 5-kinase
MMASDLLILFSDIDGLYTAPPNDDPNATLIEHIDRITPEIEAMAGDAGTELSRGGMVTKIEAGKIATQAGTAMVIASGKTLNPISVLRSGGKSSWFKANGTPVTSRKKWIAGQLGVTGALHLDGGAERALRSGRSLLPAGIKHISGQFDRGDIVGLINVDGYEIGRGVVAYDSKHAQIICGKQSADIARLLGFEGRSEMVHRDDLALKPVNTKSSDS